MRFGWITENHLICFKKICVLSLYLLIVVFLSCDEVAVIQNNPYDPSNPNYTAPQVNLIAGPTEGSLINTHVVTFQWEGNELVSEYRYNIDHRHDSLSWSDWSEQTSVSINYLDEGDHTFSVQSRYDSGDTSEAATVNYLVDAVKGPALIFYPRKQIVSLGGTTSFQIIAEEVEDLTAAEFTITFEPDRLSVISVTQGSFFKEQGESIFLHEYTNDNGLLTISTLFLGGDIPGINGTGVLAVIDFTVNKTGNSSILFDGDEVFRNPQNLNITIKATVSGIVEVE